MIAPRTRRGDGRLTAALDPQDQGPQDECGVFGVWAPGEEVAKLAYYGLYALQHRGQESAGIAVSDGGRIAVYKDIGLVSQVFDEATLTALSGHIAVGHCRYSTTGVNKWANAQPTLGATADDGTVALAHNGNLVNSAELAQRLGRLDEGAAHVRVLHEALAERQARGVRVAHGGGRAGLGHGDHDVGLDRLLEREAAAHLHAGLVHGAPGDRGVRPGEVDVLEHAAGRLGLGEAGGADALLVDRDHLAGLDLPDERGADGGEGRLLGGHHPAPLEAAEHERAHTLRVALTGTPVRTVVCGVPDPWARHFC